MASRFESHRFLGAATGLIYEQQIAWIGENADRLKRLGRPARVLDWGCGKGHISYLLRLSGFDVTSCDIASQQSDSTFGQTTPIIEEQGIDVIPLRDPILLPFGSGSYDMVTSFGVLEHVADDAGSLQEISRVLAVGGYFFCSFLPYKWSWTQFVARAGGDGYHDRLYTEASVRSAFNSHRLAVEFLGHGQFFPKNRWRQSERIERLDGFLCRYTPLRFAATNLVILASRY